MDMNDVRTVLGRQSGDLRGDMLRTFGLSPMRLDDWLNGETQFDEETEDQLRGWALGEYGMSSTTGGYVRQQRTVKAVPLGVRAESQTYATTGFNPVPSPANDFTPEHGQPVGMKVHAATNKGGNLPDPEKLKFEANIRAEREAEKQRRRPKPIPLSGFLQP